VGRHPEREGWKERGMITQEIDFRSPRSTAEVLAILQEHGDNAKLLGGGMSLVPTMNLGLARPALLISLNHVPELAYVRDEGGMIAIGACTRHADVLADPLVRDGCPVLAEAARNIGDVQVRNRGMIGGSVAHADPAADYLPVLSLLDASIVVRSVRGERVLPANTFFVDVMLTALEPDELIAEIRVPRLPPRTAAAYLRLARVEGSFAIVNAATIVGAGSARAAVGGVAAKPILIDLTEQTAGIIDDQTLDAAANVVRVACRDPYEDLNGDADYRREMAVVYVRRALQTAADRIPA
jgi:CO/xanthine dehydrogenase FAD-binding subunit